MEGILLTSWCMPDTSQLIVAVLFSERLVYHILLNQGRARCHFYVVWEVWVTRGTRCITPIPRFMDLDDVIVKC